MMDVPTVLLQSSNGVPTASYTHVSPPFLQKGVCGRDLFGGAQRGHRLQKSLRTHGLNHWPCSQEAKSSTFFIVQWDSYISPQPTIHYPHFGHYFQRKNV
jgi:hypothetical protein